MIHPTQKLPCKKLCQKSRILLTLLQVIKHNSQYFCWILYSRILGRILLEIHSIKRHCDLIGHKASTLFSSIAFYWVFTLQGSRRQTLKSIKRCIKAVGVNGVLKGLTTFWLNELNELVTLLQWLFVVQRDRLGSPLSPFCYTQFRN